MRNNSCRTSPPVATVAACRRPPPEILELETSRCMSAPRPPLPPPGAVTAPVGAATGLAEQRELSWLVARSLSPAAVALRAVSSKLSAHSCTARPCDNSTQIIHQSQWTALGRLKLQLAVLEECSHISRTTRRRCITVDFMT